VSVFGGRGKIYGVIAAAFLIGALASALRLVNVTSDVINIITGTLLVISVVAASFLAWLQKARRRPGRPPAGAAAATKAPMDAAPAASPDERNEQ
jgi:rhamnose transport system permease protein